MTEFPKQRFTINSRSYDGALKRSWTCDLVESRPNSIELHGSFAEPIVHPNLGTVEAGTVSKEKFYFDRWYNYFVFENKAGILRNYYINICLPPEIGYRTIDYVDLDIDIVLWPNGEISTLDMDEFESNAVKFGYPDEIREGALKTMETLQEILNDRYPRSLRPAIDRL